MKKETLRRLFIIPSLVGTFLFFSSNVSLAGLYTFDFIFENDGNLANSPFGTLLINDDIADTLQFDVTADTSKLGPDADIHQFGFMLNYGGSLNFSAITPNAFSSVPASGSVQGRNSTFDWVVDYGTGGPGGNPIHNPISFSIAGAGLTIGNILTANLSEQNGKPDAQFMMHVQQTSTNAGSEAVGGIYNQSPPAPVPEPATMLLFGTGLVGLVGAKLRRKK